MKRIDYRQNKMIQTKAAGKPFKKSIQGAAEEPAPVHEIVHDSSGGSCAVFGLVSDLFFASKIAQAAKHCHLPVHNFDKAGPLLEHAQSKAPALVILDWDGCEAEAYKVLKAFRGDEKLKGIPAVGYVSHVKADVKDEAERAGCLRVYSKVEFARALEDLLIRYAL